MLLVSGPFIQLMIYYSLRIKGRLVLALVNKLEKQDVTTV